MKQQLKDFFSYSKKERRGIFVLLAIIILIIVVKIILPHLKKDNNVDFSGFENYIKAFEESQREADSIKNLERAKNRKYYSDAGDIIKKKELNPFRFDPNGLPTEKWKELGLTDKQIKVIKNYESKGGKFYQKEDLKKIYTISDEEYEILEPYIVIQKEAKVDYSTEEVNIQENKTIAEKIEINSADENELKKLNGIGPSFASRIVKYRNLLGGYCNVEQLMEVYGMDSTRYSGITDAVEINTELIEKINVNTSTYKTILRHPYIDKEITNAIVNYRAKVGKIKSIEELRENKIIADLVFNRISPYLKI